MSTGVTPAAVDTLQTQIRGIVLRPDEDAYDTARTLWSALIDRRPAVIVRCVNAADVRRAVSFAREHNLLVGVNAGGKSVFKHAECKDGLLIDLSLMKGIQVDPERKTVRAEPGVLVGEFDRATQAFGLATTAGMASTVGLAGLTLGGGIGRLGRKYGLTCDNLLSVDIVTAAGTLLSVNAEQHPDLFWAVRGGGGNFGIATSFEYQLHPVGPTLLAGTVMYPISQAKDILAFYDEYTREAPDEVSADLLLATLPTGEPVVGLSLCYVGPITEGEHVLQPLRHLGTPLVDDVGPISYTDLQASGADLFPAGLHYYWTSQFMTEISPAAIETLLSRFAQVPSPRSTILFQLFGGAISRVKPSATAFYHRAARHDCIMISAWDDPTDSERQMKWAHELGQAMKPFMSTGFYLNNLCDESVQQIQDSYGENYKRLVSVKNTYDPTNLFRLNPNVKPTV